MLSVGGGHGDGARMGLVRPTCWRRPSRDRSAGWAGPRPAARARRPRSVSIDQPKSTGCRAGRPSRGKARAAPVVDATPASARPAGRTWTTTGRRQRRQMTDPDPQPSSFARGPAGCGPGARRSQERHRPDQPAVAGADRHRQSLDRAAGGATLSAYGSKQAMRGSSLAPMCCPGWTCATCVSPWVVPSRPRAGGSCCLQQRG
jgi:hypothetical protein